MRLCLVPAPALLLGAILLQGLLIPHAASAMVTPPGGSAAPAHALSHAAQARPLQAQQWAHRDATAREVHAGLSPDATSFNGQSFSGGGTVASVPFCFAGAYSGGSTQVGFFLKIPTDPTANTTLLDLAMPLSYYFRLILQSDGHLHLQASSAGGTIDLDISTVALPLNQFLWVTAVDGRVSGQIAYHGEIGEQDGTVLSDVTSGTNGLSGDQRFTARMGLGVTTSGSGDSAFPNSAGWEMSKVELVPYGDPDNKALVLARPSADGAVGGSATYYTSHQPLGPATTLLDSSGNGNNATAGAQGLTINLDGPYALPALTAVGTTPWHPQHNVRLSDGLSASIDLADGHVDLSQNDLTIPGRGPALNLGQTWDSTRGELGFTTTAGSGWLDSLTASMSGTLTGTLAYTAAVGSVWPFTYTGSLTASAPYTQYAVTPGLPYTLTAATAGYTLTNILTGQTLTFDNQGRYLATTDAYGNAATVAYASGLPSTWTAGGRALSLAYTSSGLLSDVQSPLWRSSSGAQGQHLTYGYNGNGQLTTLSRGAGTTEALTTTFGYSGTELVSVTTPISGHMWSIGYGASGRVVSLSSPISGTNSQQVGYTPAYTTTFTYNPGQTHVVEGAGTTGALTTTYTLDSQGEATAIADGLGDTTHMTYDRDHDVLTSQDANGNITSNYYLYVGPTGSVGLITETLTPPVGAFYPWSVPNQLATTYHYNASNDLVETDLPGGGITRQSYDGHHSVISSTVLMLIQTPQCNARPRKSGLQRIGGGLIVPHAICPTYFTWQASMTSYDQYGERLSTVDGRGIDTSSDFYPTVSVDTCQNGDTCPLSYTTSYTYTPQGDLASQSTPPLVTTLNGITTTAPVTTSYGYDADGNQITTTSANGYTTISSYNHLGQLVSTSLPAVQDWTGHTITPTDSTTYDGEGNVVQQVDGNGDVTLSSYDPLGRLVAQTNPVSGTTVYTYNATEQTALQDPQGNVTQSSYDPAGRLVLSTDPTGATTQYQYDQAGNTVAITMGTPLAITQVETRTYDALNRVITDTVGAPGVPGSTTVTSYDQDGNVAQVQQPNGDVTFNTYNADDQLNTVEVDPAPVMTASAPLVESYSYDSVGNVRSFEDFDGRIQNSAYDAANRLSQSTDSFPAPRR